MKSLKQKHKIQLAIVAVVMLVVLTGCSTATITDGSVPEGLFDYIVFPLSAMITFFTNLTGNGGVGIILSTIVVRLIVLPLDIWSQMSTMKMSKIQPEIKKIQDKYPNYKTDPVQSQKLNMEMQAVYQRSGTSMLGGCLPMIVLMFVQLPLLSAFFYAIQRTEILQNPDYGTLFGVTLGVAQDGIFRWFAIASIVTMLISLFIGLPKEQRNLNFKENPTALTMMIMPIMMLAILWNASAGLSVYWTTGNIITIIRTVVMNHIKSKSK